MNPDPERDVLGGNLSRVLGACQGELARSRAEFLKRAARPASSGKSRRPSSGALAVAASFLVCTSIIAAILGSGPKEPRKTSESASVAQDGQPPVKPKPPSAEEVTLADQIAFQERLLEKMTDPKERTLLLATIQTLRGELARAQKGKPMSKGTPGSAEERARQLETDLENVRAKLKTAKTSEDQDRLESKEKAILQELKQMKSGKPSPSKEGDPKNLPKGGQAGKADSRSSVELEVEIIQLAQRIQELRATAQKPELSEEDRSRMKKEAARLEAELERLQGSLPARKEK